MNSYANRRPILMWFALFGAGTAPLACAQTPEEFAGVDTILNEARSTLNLSGYTFVVVRDDQMIYQRSFGNVQPDTPIQIASATKWMSAAVVMALVDSGAITLDDTTGQWLGWTGEKSAISVRQLFSHTSGIEPGDQSCIGNFFTTLQSCAAEIESLDLIAAPGAEINYGGNSMHVAGAMCEVATDTSWVNLFQTYVKGPLGLANTNYNNAINPRIAGGMSSTADDYGRMLQMLLDGGLHEGTTILEGPTVEAMLADQTNGAAIGSLPPTADGHYLGYGIGNWVFRKTSADAVVESSSPGLFGFSPWIDRERRYYAILAVVDLNVRTDPYVRQLREEVNAILDAGDLDCDFSVTAADATIFVDRLIDATGNSGCAPERADVNRDGAANGQDVEPFVNRLIGS